MKLKLTYIIIASLIMLTAFSTAACTDETAVQDPNEQTRGEEEKKLVPVYLGIDLNTIGGTGSTTRATSGGYQDGSKDDATYDESTIQWTDLYFFDNDGNPYPINVNGSNIRRLTELTENAENTTGNVEAQYGSANGGVLVLWITEEQRNNGNFPKLVTAVANSAPRYTDLPLNAIKAQTLTTEEAFTTIDGKKYAVMTTASFYDAAGSYNSQTYPFAVKLTADSFKETLLTAQAEPVEIYVERLWSKVTLTVSGADGDELKIKVPYGADGNEEKEVTIKLHAWGLNATEENIFLMKDIIGLNTTSWVWNTPANHRSCWGKSVHYEFNAENYANSGSEGDIVFNDTNIELDKNADLSGKALTYYSLNDFYNPNTNTIGTAGTRIGESLYTLEHMPNPKHYEEKDNYACLTSVILIAQIMSNENLYRYSGSSWSQDDLVKLLYSMYIDDDAPGDKKYPNIWKKISNTEYKKIGPEYFQLVDLGDGLVGLGTTEILDNSLRGKDGAEELYVYYDIGYGYGPQFYSYKEFGAWKSPGNPDKTILQNVYEELRTYNEKVYIPMNINGFKDGWMYYNIPIEHLGQNEGQYGVVRNHWYDIDVTKIEKLGWGIFDPVEQIVPIPRTFDGYGLSFKMQVAPWHVKEYNITLDGTKTETGTGN